MLLAVITIFTCSVAFSETNQEAFLSDMLSGIRERLEAIQDETEDISYFQSLVDIELKHIEKYADEKFDDERFNTIAHQYIDACRMQLNATKLYPSSLLGNVLWNAGTNVRSALIIELYETYGLALTQDEASSYYWQFIELEPTETAQAAETPSPTETPVVTEEPLLPRLPQIPKMTKVKKRLMKYSLNYRMRKNLITIWQPDFSSGAIM